MLLWLDDEGICGIYRQCMYIRSLEPSHVLLATGLPGKYPHGSLRLPSGISTPKDVDFVLGYCQRLYPPEAMSPIVS